MNTHGHVRIASTVLAALFLASCSAASHPEPIAGPPAPIGAACAAGASSCNVVWGSSANSVGNGLTGGTISGGGSRSAPNQVTGPFGVVAGGESNVAGEGSTVSGGSQNTAINFDATVGGGANNLAAAEEATIAGGFKNTASQRWAAIGGGSLNVASDIHTTIAGGSGNTASFTFATVGGGTGNSASSTAAVVAGGENNTAQGTFSAVLGGLNNNASGYLASIVGGAGNQATGSYATVAGGFANSSAGAYSFAAGRKAEVSPDHAGTFLFADSSPFAFPSVSANEFAVRATGGVRLVTGIDPMGASLSGVRLPAGSGAWETLSDKNAKAGFAPVDEHRLLDQLMQIPIETWYYRSQDSSVRHLGPTAQDFSAAFNLGEDPHYISTVDADGVALASIQELYRLVRGASPAAQPQIESLQQQLVLSNTLAVLALAVALIALMRPRPLPDPRPIQRPRRRAPRSG